MSDGGDVLGTIVAATTRGVERHGERLEVAAVHADEAGAGLLRPRQLLGRVHFDQRGQAVRFRGRVQPAPTRSC